MGTHTVTPGGPNDPPPMTTDELRDFVLALAHNLKRELQCLAELDGAGSCPAEALTPLADVIAYLTPSPPEPVKPPRHLRLVGGRP